MAFSPDGRLFAWAGLEGVIEVHETATFQRVTTLSGLVTFIHSLAFSPDSRALAAASRNGSVKLWDVATSKPLLTLHGYSGGVWDLAFSPDGSQLTTAGADARVMVWDITDHQEVATLRPRPNGRLAALALSPDRRYLALGYSAGRLRLWDLETWTPTFELPGLNTLSVAFHPGGKRFASGDTNGIVRLWDTSGQEITRRQQKGLPLALHFAADGRQLLVAGWENAVYRWEPESGEAPTVLVSSLGAEDGRGTSQKTAFSLDGRWLAYAEWGHTAQKQSLTILDLQTPGKRLTLPDAPAVVTTLAFDRAGRSLAVASSQGAIEVREVRTGRRVHSLPGHAGMVHGLTFTVDGSRLASSGADGHVKLWDPRAAVEVLSLRKQITYETTLAFCPRGELLVAAGWDGFPRVWSLEVPTKNFAEVRRRVWHREQADRAVQDRHWFASRHHHGRLIELEPDQRQHRESHGRANAELGAWGEAAADFDAALAHPECPAAVYLDRALLYLRAGDAAGYRWLCQRMLERFGAREDGPTCNAVAWTCVLVPDCPVAPDRLVGLAQRALGEATPRNRSLVLNTLGAALYRAGRPEEAVRQLLEAVDDRGKEGIAEDWLFLALVYHRLEQGKETQRWFRRAAEGLMKLQTAAVLPDKRRCTWQMRVELDLLLREAEALLRTKEP